MGSENTLSLLDFPSVCPGDKQNIKTISARKPKQVLAPSLSLPYVPEERFLIILADVANKNDYAAMQSN